MSLFTLPVYLTPPTLAEGTCWPATPQELVNDIFAAVQAQIESSVNPGMFSQGSDVPDVDSRIYPWLRTAGDSQDGWYTYSGTHAGWISANREAATSSARRIFTGSVADLALYDGGDTGVAGEASGPMWEIDTNFSARMPLGVGTLPLSTTPVAVGDTGGLDQITLSPSNIQHYHGVGLEWPGTDDGWGLVKKTWSVGTAVVMRIADMTGGATWSDLAGQLTGTGSTTIALSDPSNVATAFSNLPPYIGVYFIKRTSRKYYWIAP